MPLHWKLNKHQAVDESVFMPGKALYMEASGPRNSPPQLQVYQVYCSAMRQILSHVGVPERRALTSFATELRHDRSYRSTYRWALPEPRGGRKSSCFVFTTDDAHERSPHIFSSRVGVADLMLRGGVVVADPTGLTPFGLEGRAAMNVRIRFARDPRLMSRVLTGQELVDHMVTNLVEDVGRDDDPEDRSIAARIETALSSLRPALLAAYTPPGSWVAELSGTDVSGGEGDVVEQTLTFHAPSEGSGYFAVSYYDESDPTVGETTDAWLIGADVNGNVSVTIDTSGQALRLPAF